MDWSFLVEKRFKSGQKCTYQQFFRPLCSKMLTKLSTRYQQSYQQSLLINSWFLAEKNCVMKWEEMGKSVYLCS